MSGITHSENAIVKFYSNISRSSCRIVQLTVIINKYAVCIAVYSWFRIE